MEIVGRWQCSAAAPPTMAGWIIRTGCSSWWCLVPQGAFEVACSKGDRRFLREIWSARSVVSCAVAGAPLFLRGRCWLLPAFFLLYAPFTSRLRRHFTARLVRSGRCGRRQPLYKSDERDLRGERCRGRRAGRHPWQKRVREGVATDVGRHEESVAERFVARRSAVRVLRSTS